MHCVRVAETFIYKEQRLYTVESISIYHVEGKLPTYLMLAKLIKSVLRFTYIALGY